MSFYLFSNLQSQNQIMKLKFWAVMNALIYLHIYE